MAIAADVVIIIFTIDVTLKDPCKLSTSGWKIHKSLVVLIQISVNNSGIAEVKVYMNMYINATERSG